MNIYVVVEGKTETEVYKSWISLVNPDLSHVDSISDVTQDNFILYSGKGYPYYFEVIDDAISDINSLDVFDRLVISVDSEDMSREEKLIEIEEYLRCKSCSAQIRIVIQHFCLETWALGNRIVVRRHPNSNKLREYKSFFDVRFCDPELLPPYEPEEFNRAQFAAKYLRAVLNDRYRGITYSKGTPKYLCHNKYFNRIKSRFEETNHIPSFEAFLNAFI